jgi:hypothetical protein
MDFCYLIEQKVYYDYYEVIDMEEKNIGVSLTKIIEEGELLAQNINRGVKIAKEKNTLEAIEKIVKKVSNFYNDINSIRLNGDNRSKVISIFKAVRPALNELNILKINLSQNKTELQPSPSM